MVNLQQSFDKHAQETLDEIARKEGWGLFVRTDDMTYEIERLDEEAVFESDDEAIHFVFKQAMDGSKPHQLAIWMDGKRINPARQSLLWIPEVLRSW